MDNTINITIIRMIVMIEKFDIDKDIIKNVILLAIENE